MRETIAIVLAAAALLIVSAGKADGPPPVSAAPIRFVDASPVGPTVAERLLVIRERIQQALVYPATARMQQLEGETWVRFDIGRDGAARKVAVERSSGVPTLDRAAEDAVAGAAPLPWVYGRLEVPVLFALGDRR